MKFSSPTFVSIATLLLALLFSFTADSRNITGDCPLPTGLTLLSNNGTSATVAWDALPGISKYAVQIENNNNGTPFFNLEQIVNNATEFTVNGLQDNGSYKFKVRSYCGNGDHGDWTDWTSFNSTSGGGNGGGACNTVPNGLTVTANAASVTLSWSAVNGATGYSYEIENAFGNPIFLHLTGNVNTTSVEITGLVANASYKFKVRTNCGGDHSNWSAWFAFGSTSGGGGGNNQSCPVPDGLAAAGISNSAATLNWNAVTGAISYTIEVEQVQGPDLVEQVVGTNTFPISGLLPSTAYKFKVRSNCGLKHSSWSPWFTFVTPSSIIVPIGNHASKFSNSGAFNLSLFPNPVSQGGQITLSFEAPATQAVNFLIQNATGKAIYQNTVQSLDGQVSETFSVGQLPKGLYFIQAVSGGTSVVSKLIVTE